MSSIPFILAAGIIWYLILRLCREDDKKMMREFYKGDLK